MAACPGMDRAPAAGLPAGWLLTSVAGWLASLPWVPFQGPFELVASVPEPHGSIGALAIGGLAGLVLAILAALDRLTVTVADDQATFTRGGVWQADGDPHRDEYRRWVDDVPDLPVGANVLLRARARALDKGDGDEVAQLRADLARLGVVVRDESKRQRWRRRPS
jgi:hypothetical protein